MGELVFRLGRLGAAWRYSRVVLPLALALTGCRQDMHDQPKFFPLRGSSMFTDGRSARGQVEGTVARSQGDSDSYFNTGLKDGKEGDGFPFKVTEQVLQRGQERFNIYCTPCHSRTGNGQGILVQRGYYQAANFHSERLRQAPAGHFFNVITHGYGAMPEYHVELSAADRWAVIAYIRALQLSQNAKREDAAAGAPIERLAEIAEEEGLPISFANNNWTRPVVLTPVVPSAARPASISTSQTTTPAPVKSQTSVRTGLGLPNQQSVGSELKAEKTPGKQTEGAPSGDAVAGKNVYTQNCQICHQANRGGLPPVIPSLVDIVTRVGAPHIRDTVTNGIPTGKPPMPSFAEKLSSTDIDNLIAFLKTKP